MKVGNLQVTTVCVASALPNRALPSNCRTESILHWSSGADVLRRLKDERNGEGNSLW